MSGENSGDLAASLKAALSVYDEADAECPARKPRFNSDKDCPRCGASVREGCSLDIGGMYAFVQTARALVAPPLLSKD